MPAQDKDEQQSTLADCHSQTFQEIEKMTQKSTTAKTGEELVKYLHKILKQTENLRKGQTSRDCDVQCDTSPEQIRIKWRRAQISSQLKLASVVDSSWRKAQPQVIWCGHLRKGLPTPWKQPQERWFEARKEPTRQGWGTRHIVVMQYQRGSSAAAKRLIVTDPRREAARDIIGKAYISVAVEGRRGRLMLSLVWDHEADALVRRIAAALWPACSFLP